MGSRRGSIWIAEFLGLGARCEGGVDRHLDLTRGLRRTLVSVPVGKPVEHRSRRQDRGQAPGS